MCGVLFDLRVASQTLAQCKGYMAKWGRRKQVQDIHKARYVRHGPKNQLECDFRKQGQEGAPRSEHPTPGTGPPSQVPHQCP